MKGVSESLVGRVGILEMTSLAYAEKYGLESNIFDPRSLVNRFNIEPVRLFEEIFKGGMPEYYINDIDRRDFFDNYIKTYIERDFGDLIPLKNAISFYNFLVSMASRNGELLNYSSICQDAGIDEKTAKLWVSILVNSDIYV